MHDLRRVMIENMLTKNSKYKKHSKEKQIKKTIIVLTLIIV
jgi:hypothetical protein